MVRRARYYLPGAVALGLVVLLGLLVLPPSPSSAALSQLAQRYDFARHPLSTEQWSGAPLRAFQPDLQRISAWMSSLGAAVAVSDVDGDGLPNDVCLVDPRFDAVSLAPAPQTGQRYARRVLIPTGVPYDPKISAPMGCVPADLNADGHADLLVYYWGRSPVLFLRDPEVALGQPAAFVDQDLVSPPRIWNTAAVNFADVDGDGHQDIVVGNYFPDGARLLDTTLASDPAMHLHDSMSNATNGGRNRILLWSSATGGASPSVTFREAEGALSDEVAGAWTLAVGAQDLNGDGLPELYFANDFGRDTLLVNHSTPGTPRFTPAAGQRDFVTPRSKVVGHDSFKGMGVAFPDLNDDAWPDIVVSNITSNYAFHESNQAWLSTGQVGELDDGRAPYRDGSERLGLSRSGWAWDVKAGDFDNDGQPEIIQAVGFVRGTANRWPQLQQFAMATDPIMQNPRLWPGMGPGTELSGHERNPFFVRPTGGNRFVDISGELGLEQPGVSRGIALADVDHDGRLDFAVANQWAPSYLLRNTAPSARHYLGLQLRLPATTGDGTVPAIGASIRVTKADGRVLVDQVYPTNGHAGVSAPEAMFGLADDATAVSTEIRWRDSTGVPHATTRTLSPGWHRLLLTPDGRMTETTP